jgi:hypothetical protein
VEAPGIGEILETDPVGGSPARRVEQGRKQDVAVGMFLLEAVAAYLEIGRLSDCVRDEIDEGPRRIGMPGGGRRPLAVGKGQRQHAGEREGTHR